MFRVSATIAVSLTVLAVCAIAQGGGAGGSQPFTTTVYIAKQQTPVPVNGYGTIASVLTLNLPLGTFLVHGKVMWANGSSLPAQGAECRLVSTGWTDFVDRAWLRVEGSGAGTVPFLATVTSSVPFSLTIVCGSSAEYGQAELGVLTATKVNNVIQQ